MTAVTPSGLAVPLTERQVEAANTLRDRMPGWIAVDQALTRLAARFPETDFASTLVKCATLNQLYGTRVLAIQRAATHVASVLREADLPSRDDPEAVVALVERLAAVPPTPGQERSPQLRSFAAKFAHFFIDRERFPIFDSYASRMVTHHLGYLGRIRDASRPYRAFVLNLHLLKERAALNCGWAELDHYLWLAGQYRAWQRNPAAEINREPARLFAAASPEVAAELAIMEGTGASMRGGER
jgi:hypothetical protein